jgi:lipoprotein NlpD
MIESHFLKRLFTCLAIASVVAGCAASRPAPVTEARPTDVATTPPAIPTPPPVVVPPGAIATPLGKPGEGTKVHVIQRGETMRSIATLHGLDYRELAAWNNIENPAVIRVGDTLRLSRPDGQTVTGAPIVPGDTSMPSSATEVVATPLVLTPPPAPDRASVLAPPSATLKTEPRAAKVPYSDQAYARMLAEAGQGVAAPVLSATPTTPPAVSPSVSPPAIPSASPGASVAVPPASVPASPSPSSASGDTPDWAWPVKGNIIAKFTESNKGIDIAGTKGTPILAAAPGKVIYNESGFRGYGRLIIIKHNDNWLSAYAHNDKVLVKKDEDIKKGQKIAEMGASDTDRVKLHFEIRKQGKPVDPLKYLPAQ